MDATVKLTPTDVEQILIDHFGVKGFNVNDVKFIVTQNYDREDRPLGMELTRIEVNGFLPNLN